jgi:DNA replication and repair protein RecF
VPLSLRVEELQIVALRNLSRLNLEFAPRLNVIAGDNGQGKTSVLEALYFLATSRSFRTERLQELRQEGSSVTRVKGSFMEGSLRREQSASLGHGARKLSIDDKPAERLSSYAVRTPVVVFHPGDLQLVVGSAALRRRLLDRVALFREPSSGDVRLSYQRAQKERQAVLLSRGTQARELSAFEELMARFGVQLGRARQRAAEALREALYPAFARMAAIDLVLSLAYQAGGADDEETFAAELLQRRERDRRRKTSDYGPQRDDLELSINGRSARRHASQGQQRVLTLALKAAELSCIRDARQAEPLLLLDDVSSELDPSRIGAVYEFIYESQSQVFVTTTRPELFQLEGFQAAERRDFLLAEGALKST